MFGVIIMGIAAYMVHEFRDADLKPPNKTVIPLVAGVLTVAFTIFSIVAIFFLSHTMQMVAAVVDFVIWLFYLASAGLLRHDYHLRRNRNPLYFAIRTARLLDGKSPHSTRSSSLVKTLSALVLIQIILFFFTTVLGFFVASRSRDRIVPINKTETREVPVSTV